MGFRKAIYPTQDGFRDMMRVGGSLFILQQFGATTYRLRNLMFQSRKNLCQRDIRSDILIPACIDNAGPPPGFGQLF